MLPVDNVASSIRSPTATKVATKSSVGNIKADIGRTADGLNMTEMGRRALDRIQFWNLSTAKMTI
jgi:hypothetical protein